MESLRDKCLDNTHRAVREELSHTQFTILKQVLTQHDRTLARQLCDPVASQETVYESKNRATSAARRESRQQIE